MKKNFLAAFASLSLITLSATATPLIYEGFDYPLSPTNLVGQVNPGGGTWQSAGVAASATNQPYIVAGSLTTPGLSPSVGNSLQFGGKGFSARLAMNSISSGSIYYSFILKITDITALGTGTAGVFFAAVTGGSFVGTSEPSLLVSGLLAKKVPGSTTKYVLGIKKAGAGAAFSSPSLETTNTVGDQVFIVASYKFVSGPGTGTADEARLWINPNPATFNSNAAPTETIISTGSADLSAAGSPLNGFTIYNRQGIAEPNAMQMDELSIGTTWADVTPTGSTLAILTQPKPERVLVGNTATFSVGSFRATTFQWQKDSVNIPNATNNTLSIPNAQFSNAGNYQVIVGNGVATPITSSAAALTMVSDIYPRLAPIWSLAPFSRPYITTDGSTLPNQRYFAYNSFSNTLLVVSRTNTTVSGSSNAIYVLDASSGKDLYQMKVDPAVIQGGLDPSTNGFLLTLNCIDVAADGAVYGANIHSNFFNLYRWADAGTNTPAVRIFSGDPSGLGARYGDSMVVRGSGSGTEVLLDSQDGQWGVIMVPTTAPSDPDSWQNKPFTNVIGGTVGGRTLVFGDTNSFWEKHKGPLTLASYDLTGSTSTTIITNSGAFGNVGVSGFNLSKGLLAGLNLVSSANTPDTVDLYDISDLSQPLYISSCNFPTNHQANGNSTGRVLFIGDRVFALDSNNGLMALGITVPLSISSSGTTVTVTWSTNASGFTLQATPSLNSPVAWTNTAAGVISGSNYSVTESIGAAPKFYRLSK